MRNAIHPAHPAQTLFRTSDLVRARIATARQLQLWRENGLIAAQRIGWDWFYDQNRAAAAIMISELRKRHLSLRNITKRWPKLLEALGSKIGFVLLQGCLEEHKGGVPFLVLGRLTTVGSGAELIERVKRQRFGALAIDVEEIWRRVYLLHARPKT